MRACVDKRESPLNLKGGSSAEVLLILLLAVCSGSGDCADSSSVALIGQVQAGDRVDGVAANDRPQRPTAGRVPFPASESVLATCPTRAVAAGAPCGRVIHDLDEFANEERDPAWAEVIEARIREDIVAQCPQHAQCAVRALECRTSLCVAEVSSTDGWFNYFPLLDDGFLRSKGIVTGYWLAGDESLPSGDTLTVTLFMMGRREHLPW